MTNVLNWLRNNPISVAAIVVSLVALGIFGYAHLRNGALQARMAEQSRDLSTLSNLKSQTVNYPNSDPTQPEIAVRNISINQGVIDEFKIIYSEFDEQFTNLYDYTLEQNRAGKAAMLDGLFPSPANPSIPFDARVRYKDSLVALLQPPPPTNDDSESNTPAPPRLDAGTPPTEERVATEVFDAQERTENSIISSRLEAETEGFTADEQEDILAEKRQALLDVLTDTASNFSVYAGQPGTPEFPFVVAQWADLNTSPPIDLIWEAQMQLWVLEDVVSAIATANRDAQAKSGGTGVVGSVVKRLLRLDVEPGYVGLSNPGMADDSTNRPTGGFSFGGDPRGRSSNAALIAGDAGSLIRSPEQAQPDNFVVSPTGRMTNGVYIVRHAVLNAHVSFNEINLLMEAVKQTNFMTVIDVDILQVDEFDVMADRYFYGSDDVVEVRMRIEVLYLREWLEPYMPSDIRRQLGVPQ
ncbi:MAG: hypothetical protein AAF823_07640 [Planctomycetota bacterium]